MAHFLSTFLTSYIICFSLLVVAHISIDSGKISYKFYLAVFLSSLALMVFNAMGMVTIH